MLSVFFVGARRIVPVALFGELELLVAMGVVLGCSRLGISGGRVVCFGFAVFLLLDLFGWGGVVVRGGFVEYVGC